MSDPRDFQHQFKYLMGVAKSQGLSQMDAEDVVSSAVLSILEAYPDEDEALRAAGRVTVNRKIVDGQRNWYAQQTREAKLRALASRKAAASAEAVMLEKASEDEISALRRAIVEGVAPEYRALEGEIFDWLLDVSLNQIERNAVFRAIALRYGRNPATLKSRAQRIRVRMRKHFLGARPWTGI